MLLLICRAAGNLYAIDAGHLVEVVPRVALRAIPHAPAALAGMFSYRGRVVPVLDLGLLLGGSACRQRLSTRIIVVRFALDGREDAVLGLIAEEVSDLRPVRPHPRGSSTFALEQAPYLGTIYQLDEGLVQGLVVERLLDDAVLDGLFGARPEARR